MASLAALYAQMRWALVAAAAAATIVGFVLLSSSQGSPDALLFKTNHKLNDEEKQFVKRVSLRLLSMTQTWTMRY